LSIFIKAYFVKKNKLSKTLGGQYNTLEIGEELRGRKRKMRSRTPKKLIPNYKNFSQSIPNRLFV